MAKKIKNKKEEKELNNHDGNNSNNSKITKKQNQKTKSKFKSKLNKKILTKKKGFIHKFKKHKKEIIRSLILLMALLIIFYVAINLLQLRSVYAEQITMQTEPQYKHFFLKQGEQGNTTIKTEIQTNLFCYTNCEYSLTDLSKNKIVDEGKFSFYNFKIHEYEASLKTEELGTGQELYLYNIECKIKESRMCKPVEFPVIKNTIITLNYEPSTEQLMKKEEIKSLMGEVTSSLSNAEAKSKESLILINNLSWMKKNHLEKELIEISFFQEVFKRNVDKIKEDWLTQNYTYVKQEIDDIKLTEKAIHLKTSSDNLLNKIIEEREIHNYVIDSLKKFKEELSLLEKLRTAVYLITEEQKNKFDELFSDYFNLYAELSEQEFNSYTELKNKFDEAQQKKEDLNKKYDEILTNQTRIFSEATTLKTMINNDLCYLTNCTQEELLNNLLELENMTNVEQKLKSSEEICEEIVLLEEQRQKIINETKQKRENLTQQELFIIDEQKEIMEIINIRKEIQSLPTNFEKERQQLLKYLNITNNETTILSEDISENEKEFFLPAKYYEEDLKKFLETCSIPKRKFPEITIKKEPLKKPPEIKPSEIKILEEISASCCFKSTCTACCDYEECREKQRNPLIVLHGYSFYSFNSALHSTNAFNDFTLRALNESLYYPAGIIGSSFYEDYKEEDLTRNFVPPLFKATYYNVVSVTDINPGELNIISKSIKDYADNLHEIIEYVKKVTGKDQVDIVAHSMGGLVTRTYTKEYGEDSLGKIILVGTPNKGIPMRLVYLCRFFGGQTECEEMYEQSSFMKYLEETKEPKMHILIGEGCNTFGEEGDGVVAKRSAELETANKIYFQGTCDLIDNFHRDMIKPTKYPEIYEEIINILLDD